MDPIADLLVRIKNSQSVGREVVEAPFSQVKFEIAKILEKEGFVSRVDRKGVKPKERIEIVLKYDQGEGAIQEIKRVSRPGQRIYSSVQKLRPVKQGYGILIVSTSQGIMTDREAKKQKLGGEVICQVS